MPLWPNKRDALARILGRVGLVSLLETVGRRPGLVVLCYHRVGDPETDPFYAPLVSARPEVFREQMERLSRAFRILSLEQALDALTEGGPREPSALVTFDDGYRDNLDLAAPILLDLKVPATLFLTSGFLDGHLPWWDHVAAVVNRSPAARLRLDRPEPIEGDLTSPESRALALSSVILAYLRAARPDDPALVAHLQERAEVDLDTRDLARSLFLSWDGVREWVQAGFSVGAHTSTHRKLSSLSPSEQAAELIEPRRRIEQETGRPVLSLAYPFGDPSAFTAETKRLALEAGYRAAFALRSGVAGRGPLDLFALPRFNVMAADSPALLRARLALSVSVGRSVL
ncbi:MAG TPA: polysaccharide deacetylase family protein [Isosphaeraceae bacterium]|nr:polysaccharide deacetylase family protein [Isosphaeraceae bacterium]